MAGRGTDILLGGNPEFLARQYLKEKEINPDEATEQQWEDALSSRASESPMPSTRRSSARAGFTYSAPSATSRAASTTSFAAARAARAIPGSSRFYLSLEDDLMRIFGGERIKGLMLRLGMEEGVPIESRLVSKRIEGAQKSVEGHNFSIRKHLLEYDDVMNKQREAVYGMRRQLLMGFEGDTPEEQNANQREYILGHRRETSSMADRSVHAKRAAARRMGPGRVERAASADLRFRCRSRRGRSRRDRARKRRARRIWPKLEEKYEEKEVQLGVEAMRNLERYIMLNIVDAQWKDHLLALDHLKEGIGLARLRAERPAGRVQARVLSICLTRCSTASTPRRSATCSTSRCR